MDEEEIKEDTKCGDQGEIFDLSSLPTQVLFKISKSVLDTIRERLVARDAGISARLDKIIDKWGYAFDYCRPRYYTQKLGNFVGDISLQEVLSCSQAATQDYSDIELK